MSKIKNLDSPSTVFLFALSHLFLWMVDTKTPTKAKKKKKKKKASRHHRTLLTLTFCTAAITKETSSTSSFLPTYQHPTNNTTISIWEMECLCLNDLQMMVAHGLADEYSKDDDNVVVAVVKMPA